jgi:hypothetical protein
VCCEWKCLKDNSGGMALKLHSGVLHDNIYPYMTTLSMARCTSAHFTVLDNSPHCRTQQCATHTQFWPLTKVLQGQRLRSDKDAKTTVSAAAQGVLCRGDPSAGAAITGQTHMVLSMDLNHSRQVRDR